MTSRNYSFILAIALTALFSSVASLQAEKTHLMILSGQSNMAGLKPETSFTPTVTKGLAPDKVIVVKSARGGQPIRRWYKKWKPETGNEPTADGELYDRMMVAVKAAIGDKKPDTVTFIWMQGERDAKEKHGNVYAASMKGLIDQLSADLGRNDVNFVIGRLSDYKAKDNEHWEKVRQAQVKVAKDSKRGEWVDTDDLNGPKNGLHYARPAGYNELGKRFAEAAIKLVKQSK